VASTSRHQPVMEPASTLASSTRYKDQVPLGLLS
jgi:hypothetical protein